MGEHGPLGPAPARSALVMLGAEIEIQSGRRGGAFCSVPSQRGVHGREIATGVVAHALHEACAPGEVADPAAREDLSPIGLRDLLLTGQMGRIDGGASVRPASPTLWPKSAASAGPNRTVSRIAHEIGPHRRGAPAVPHASHRSPPRRSEGTH